MTHSLLLPTLFSVAGAAVASAQDAQSFDPNDYFDVRMHGAALEDVAYLTEIGIDIQNRTGSELLLYLSTAELARLRDEGFELTPLPQVGRGASRAGYPTFQELSQELLAAQSAFPQIAKVSSIGESTQGRPLLFIKISDNVDVEEDEPEFRYISTMHGDEVVGMELCLELVDLLTSQYGIDPRITRLVDEVEIWIMPLMNPDGYVAGSRYNAQGRDLNRAFPDRNSDPNNTTSGRPPEVRHVMNWGFAHSPVLSANFHGGAMVVNYPYDSDANPFANYSATPDDPLFIEEALTYSRLVPRMFNGSFNQGIVNGVEWYLVRGGMQDWNYVWQGCNDVTIELDNAKWPAHTRIAGLWNEHRDAMLEYMELSLTGIRGLVVDALTGAPLSATARIVGVPHDVYTDPDVGDFHRMALPGTYEVRVDSTGYDGRTVSGVQVDWDDATVVDVDLLPTAYAAPTPEILVNGQSGPLTVSAGQVFSLSISLDPQAGFGTAHDWWLRASSGGVDLWWKPGALSVSPMPAYNGALIPLTSLPLLNTALPAGNWTFTFGVDRLDGNFQGTFSDSISVTSL